MVYDSNVEFTQQNIRLVAKYNFIIFPISFATLQKLLTDSGYQPIKLPEGSPPLSMVVAGEIATKKDLTVDFQTDKQILGVRADSADSSISSFNEIEGIVTAELGEPASNSSQFYEAIAQFSIKTGKNPLDVFAENREKLELCEKVSEIMNENVSPFGFRFSPTRGSLQNTDWFDFRLEPLVSRASTTYYGNLVFRSKKREKVIGMTKNVKNHFITLLKELES